jgi:hypothetical protein
MIKLISTCIQLTILSLLLTACSEEAQPYEELNTTFSNSQDQGYIQTH